MQGQLESARRWGSNCEDICLIAKFLDGSEAAFEELFRKYQGRLFSLSRHLLGDYAEAEDAVQDAFLSIYHGLKHFKGRSSFLTWAYSITVRKCLSRRRKLKRHDEAPVEDLRASDRQSSPDVDRMVVQQAVAQLPDHYQTVLVLKYYEQLSIEEMAETLECSPDRLKMRLHRARNALRDVLKRSMGGETS